jgi:SsrA-binding protein
MIDRDVHRGWVARFDTTLVAWHPSGVAKRKKRKDEDVPIEKFGDGLVARNRRARFDYELGDRIEAGLCLRGSEVKVLRGGKADITEAWCKIERREVYICGMNIPELQGTPWGHEAKRPRKLLLHQHQITQLSRAIERQGMTVIATRLYFRGGHAKLEVALAKGKKTIDKRQTVKEREADRETRAAIARHSSR